MTQRESKRIARGSVDASSMPSFSGRRSKRIRKRPLRVGEVLSMLPEDGDTSGYLTVQTPSGVIVVIPPAVKKEIWLAEAGTWSYRWGDGEQKELEVLEPEPVVTEVVATAVPPQRLGTRLTSSGA